MFSPAYLKLVRLIVLVGVFVILLMIVAAPFAFFFQALQRMVFGWAFHLQHVFPEAGWSPAAVAGTLAAAFLMVLCLDALMKRVCEKKEPERRAWSFRASLALVFGVMVLFFSAICGTGIMHQAAWLMRAKWIMNDSEVEEEAFMNAHRARQLVELVKSYASQAGGVLPERLERMAGALETYELMPLLTTATLDEKIPEPWIYLGSGLSLNSPKWLPVLAEPRADTSGKRLVISLDAQGSVMSEFEYQELLSRWRGYLQQVHQE